MDDALGNECHHNNHMMGVSPRPRKQRRRRKSFPETADAVTTHQMMLDENQRQHYQDRCQKTRRRLLRHRFLRRRLSTTLGFWTCRKNDPLMIRRLLLLLTFSMVIILPSGHAFSSADPLLGCLVSHRIQGDGSKNNGATSSSSWNPSRRRGGVGTLSPQLLVANNPADLFASSSPDDGKQQQQRSSYYYHQNRRRRPVQTTTTSPSEAFTVVSDDVQNRLTRLKALIQQQQGVGVQKQKTYQQQVQILLDLLQLVGNSRGISPTMRRDLSKLVDGQVQDFCARCFLGASGNSDGDEHHASTVFCALDVLQAQRETRGLARPYRHIPKRILLNALLTLAAVCKKNTNASNNKNDDAVTIIHRALEESYRILQRLVTGHGVREPKSNIYISEKHFFNVLNAFCEHGQMEMAHRIVALQERTAKTATNANKNNMTQQQTALRPAVVYSILCKGYGKLKDVDHVDWIYQQATTSTARNNNEDHDDGLDIVFYNSLLDSYINCGAWERAQDVFDNMPLSPNRRTYNTLLKMYARSANLDNAQQLTTVMRQHKLWDSYTTNTLVQAAIAAHDLEYANWALEKYTLYSKKYRGRPDHPNVQAYTELLDYYGKQEGQLEQALQVFQDMQQRGVPPNEVTYTCLMGCLGRNRKLSLAKKFLQHVQQDAATMWKMGSTVKVYNALISGLLADAFTATTPTFSIEDWNYRVDNALLILSDMMKRGVSPNAITASVLVEALTQTHFSQPRLDEAQRLVMELERKQCIAPGNKMVGTALVNGYGRAGDLKAVLETFQKIIHPDTVAVNAFLDACCRCQQVKAAVESFDFYFRRKNSVQPDVVSFSIVIGALLKQGTADSMKRAKILYQEMKRRRIEPDASLVDVILKSIIVMPAPFSLTKSSAYFATTVLKDAENLVWDEGQLERRIRAVRSVLSDRLRNSWNNEEGIFDSLLPTEDTDDELFRRKGWNKVDSGFQLWGQAFREDGSSVDDRFLNSHGWNDIDSGFRLL